jgi:hypothetical protein
MSERNNMAFARFLYSGTTPLLPCHRLQAQCGWTLPFTVFCVWMVQIMQSYLRVENEAHKWRQKKMKYKIARADEFMRRNKKISVRELQSKINMNIDVTDVTFHNCAVQESQQTMRVSSTTRVRKRLIWLNETTLDAADVLRFLLSWFIILRLPAVRFAGGTRGR